MQHNPETRERRSLDNTLNAQDSLSERSDTEMESLK
jgi:hypothetical protein